MAEKKSRVVRYADWRRKIQSGSFFADDSAVSNDYAPDKKHRRRDTTITHNTLTFSIKDLLAEADGSQKKAKEKPALSPKGGVWDWCQSHWQWLAIGGGSLVLVIVVAIVLAVALK